MAMRNQGSTIAIKIIAPTMLDNVLENIRMESGRWNFRIKAQAGEENQDLTSQQIINGVYILGKSVHDTTKRLRQTLVMRLPQWRQQIAYCGLKERHGCIHDPLDSATIQFPRSVVRKQSKAITHEEEAHGLSNTQPCVDAHIEARRLTEFHFLPVHKPAATSESDSKKDKCKAYQYDDMTCAPCKNTTDSSKHGTMILPFPALRYSL